MTGAGDRETSQSSRNQRIECIRAEFGRAWTSLQRPRIEDLLFEVPESDQWFLLRVLILTEIGLLERDGNVPDRIEYQQRFPEFREAIDGIFRGLETTSTIHESILLISTIDSSQQAVSSRSGLPRKSEDIKSKCC